MKYYSIREFSSNIEDILESLKPNKEAILTDNGKPVALMLDISEYDYELFLRSLHQAKAMIAFNHMRAIAAEHGYMTDEEIEAVIAEVRKERQ